MDGVQAPFVTLYLYLNEAENEQEKEDLALIIEEVLRQRIKGVKNKEGVWITPAFPKLIYVLEEDNITKDSKYFYLTELAAKCTAKRLVPDYESEKKLIEAKYPTEKLLHIRDRRDQWGDEHIWGENIFKNVSDEECDKLQEIVNNRFNKEYIIPDETKEIIKKYNLKMKDIVPKAYTPMGCLDAKEVVSYTLDGILFVESFDRFWDRMSKIYPVKSQNPSTPNLYIDLDNRVKIYDMDRGMISCRRIIRNVQSEWVKVKLSNGRSLDCTIDHPFATNRGRIQARDLIVNSDIVPIDPLVPHEEDKLSENTIKYYSCDHKSEKMFATVVDLQPYACTKYSYDVTTESDYFTVSGVHSHNCRSFLTPDYIHYKTYSRFNQGVCTINLVDVALSSQKNIDDFWKIFDERLQLCYEALMIDHNYLMGTPSDVAPILWQNGALARLDKGETIDKLLVDNYSTISLGYAGLYECTKYMTGKSHTDPESEPFAISVMQHMNDKCSEWRKETNISFSLYGTPLDSTTYKFAKCLQKRFGIIEGITDRNYITNSFHVPVFEKIDAFSKLKFESKFQELSPGGTISYVEVPNMQNNIDAVISVIQFIYDNIIYAELNTKSDYCEVCGYDGEIKIVEDENGKLVWECPKCKNRDQHKMWVTRRTCGYIGTNFWNQGRTQEIKDRVLHL